MMRKKLQVLSDVVDCFVYGWGTYTDSRLAKGQDSKKEDGQDEKKESESKTDDKADGSKAKGSSDKEDGQKKPADDGKGSSDKSDKSEETIAQLQKQVADFQRIANQKEEELKKGKQNSEEQSGAISQLTEVVAGMAAVLGDLVTSQKTKEIEAAREAVAAKHGVKAKYIAGNTVDEMEESAADFLEKAGEVASEMLKAELNGYTYHKPGTMFDPTAERKKILEKPVDAKSSMSFLKMKAAEKNSEGKSGLAGIRQNN
jgi:hypothetical protein